MSNEITMFHAIDAYNELIQQYKMSDDTFATVLDAIPEDIHTGIEAGVMDTDLANLVNIIYAMTLSDEINTRLASTITALNERFSVSLETMALLSKLDLSLLRQFIDDPASAAVPSECLYRLAYTAVFLQFILCKDRKRW